MAWPDDWGRKVQIDIQASLADTTLSYFPVLINEDCIPSEVLDTTSGNECQSDGGDLRFYTGDYSAENPATENTDRIPCEVVDVTRAAGAGGKCQLWVRIPSINSSTGATIFMFYNATGKTQPAQSATYGQHETWDENGADNYKLVYHLNESSGDALNSASDSHDGTYAGSLATQIDAKCGKGQDFDGEDDHIVISDHSDFDGTGNFTASLWFNPDSIGYIHEFMAKKNAAWNGADGWYLELYSDDVLYLTGSGSNQAKTSDLTADLSAGTAYHFAIVKSAVDTVAFYLDSVDKTSDSNFTTIAANTDDLWIGQHEYYSSATDADGKFDEIRFVGVARAHDWVEAEYRNQNAPATYVVEGTPGNVAAGSTSVEIFRRRIEGY